MQGQPIKKSFFSASKTSTLHHTQTNVQQPFLNTACYCELAVQHSFFETSQSCVSTMVPLSHRFKSSPAIPGKVAIPGTAGYLMNAGHFSRNLVSSGDLNRPRESRGSQPSACFCGTFCTPQKVPIRSLCREHRGFTNLDSARHNGGFAQTKLKPFSALVSPHLVALLTSVRNSPCFGGLRRTKTCHRQLFARPSSNFFLLFVKYKK